MYQPQNRKLFDLQVEFQKYYDKKLKSVYAKLEEKRLNYNRTFWARLIIWIFFDVALFYDLCNYHKLLFIPTLFIGTIFIHITDTKFAQKTNYGKFIWAAIMIILYCTIIPNNIFGVPEWHSKIICGIFSMYFIAHHHIILPITNFNSDTKRKAQQKIIDFFGDFKYRHMNTLPAETLNESHLFRKFHTQEGDDYFFGEYQGVGITVSEETLITGHGKNRHSVFKGIVIELEMNKKFHGQTVVYINSFLKLWRSKPKMTQVILEDHIFNKKFKVYSTDQVEARYVLTTVFMENVIKLKEMYHGNSVELSFFDHHVLIAITTSKDMFESTSLFRSALGYGMISNVVRQFHYIFEIIEVLQLNKKILQ